jgi:hypothetical protein
MKEHMKRNKSFTLAAVLIISVISFACSLFTRAQETPTPDPYIFEPVTTPLKFEPDALPNAQTGVEYEEEIHISDNVTPVAGISISSGALPAGLELVFLDGEDAAKISGVPEKTGTFTFTIGAGCFGTMVSGQNGEKEYVIVVE